MVVGDPNKAKGAKTLISVKREHVECKRYQMMQGVIHFLWQNLKWLPFVLAVHDTVILYVVSTYSEKKTEIQLENGFKMFKNSERKNLAIGK